MIKKVSDINLVPEDLREILTSKNSEFVTINNNIYEMYPFTANQYLKLLTFFNKYFNVYNDAIKDKEKIRNNLDFFSNLAEAMLNNNIVHELSLLFPDIEEEFDYITFDELQYLLGMIYKLNFLQKKKINHLQNQMAVNKTMEIMGLSILTQIEN